MRATQCVHSGTLNRSLDQGIELQRLRATIPPVTLKALKPAPPVRAPSLAWGASDTRAHRNMGSNNFGGFIPSFIENMTNLVFLCATAAGGAPCDAHCARLSYLENSSFSGMIPSFFATFTSLAELCAHKTAHLHALSLPVGSLPGTSWRDLCLLSSSP